MATQLDGAMRVINGTYGEFWCDGRKWAEVDSFQIIVKKNSVVIKLCGDVIEDTKMLSVSNSGSLGGFHVDSAFADEIELTQNGKDVRHTFRGKLADPDSWGFETVEAYNATFSQLTAMDWKAATEGKINTPFTCGRIKFTDKIAVR